MKPLVVGLITVLLSLTLSGMGTIICGSTVEIPSPFNISLEPVGTMNKGLPITIRLTFGPKPKYYVCGDTGTVSVMTLTYPERDTLSIESWPVIFKENHSYSTTYDINVPDDAITKLRILIGCGWIEAYPIERTIVTTGDTVQFLVGYMPPSAQNVVRNTDPIRDTLTHEHLQVKYEVIIDLRDPSHFQIAQKILGSIPDSCIYVKGRGLYKITTTLGNLIEFGDQDFEFEFTIPPPWDPKYKDSGDSTPDIQPKPDRE